MNNQELLLAYLKNENRELTYTEIREHFNWKSNYFSKLVNQLPNNVKKGRISYPANKINGGKRFDKTLTLVTTPIKITTKTKLKSEVHLQTPTTFGPGTQPIPTPKRKYKIKINGTIPKPRALTQKELLDELRKNNKKAYGRVAVNKKDKWLFDAMEESLAKLINYQPKVVED